MHLDLNLLTALDALLEEGSVMGAADRLHLSQPAMSRTLGRIRALTGDQILVRVGRSMTPTPYALMVAPEVHQLVQRATVVLTPQRRLDLATLETTFTLQGHDALITAIAPALLSSVRHDAPGVTLRFLAETSSDSTELRQGRVDLQLGASAPTLPQLHFDVLGAGHVSVALRRGHPLLDRPLTVDLYAGADHVIVSRRGRIRDLVDDSLEELGLHRRVVAAVPSSVHALRIAAATDILTAVPAETMRPLISAFGLRTVPLPLSLPPLEAVCSWHQRYDNDPAHTWLRASVRHAFAFLRRTG